MTASNPRKPNRQPTRLEATFGRIDAPKLGRRSLMAAGLIGLLTAGAASADWRVYDQKVETVLKQINERIGEGNVNKRLEDLNTKFKIDQSANGETPAMIAEPTGDEKLDKQKPTMAQADADKLCPAGSKTPLGQQQKLMCGEIVNTELAQYRFSMRMFDRAKENYDRLKKIEDQRRSMGADDYADLQDNSNKLLALTALMDNDRDRYRTYMSAYEARIEHIRNARSALSRNAFRGTGGSGLPF